MGLGHLSQILVKQGLSRRRGPFLPVPTPNRNEGLSSRTVRGNGLHFASGRESIFVERQCFKSGNLCE